MATPYQSTQWYQHLLTLFAIFYKSNTEWTNFCIMFTFQIQIQIQITLLSRRKFIYMWCMTLIMHNVHVLYCISGSPNAYYMLLV